MKFIRLKVGGFKPKNETNKKTKTKEETYSDEWLLFKKNNNFLQNEPEFQAVSSNACIYFLGLQDSFTQCKMELH